MNIDNIDRLKNFFPRVETIGALLCAVSNKEDCLPGHALETICELLVELAIDARLDFDELCG